MAHGSLPLPAYLPDATYGVVRAVDAVDLEAAGVEAIVMNVFHLMQKPGSATIHALGGLHGFSGWHKPIITDSGGFQAYSLIHQQAGFGSITDNGLAFRPDQAGRKFHLTPEKSVQLQLGYGSDVVMCLDECTHSDAPAKEQQKAVTRTIQWAIRSRKAFDRLMAQRRPTDRPRPRLFGIVQGGADLTLRRQCADALLDIGFDGFGYGGWPLDTDGALLQDMLEATRSFIPVDFPMHALGVGHPESIVTCVRMGYELFDSALPTRDARRGRLYRFSTDPTHPDFRFTPGWFDRLFIEDKKHIRQNTPLSPHCECSVCVRYSIGYLHHLFATQETVYYRLATIHNLRFMSQLMRVLQPKQAASPEQ